VTVREKPLRASRLPKGKKTNVDVEVRRRKGRRRNENLRRKDWGKRPYTTPLNALSLLYFRNLCYRSDEKRERKRRSEANGIERKKKRRD